MKNLLRVIAILAAIWLLVGCGSDIPEQIIKPRPSTSYLIEESIRNYKGRCPCPYSIAKDGSKCGKRSAYSRPGGATPLCYPRDIE